MAKYLETKIGSIEDPEFRQMVNELCDICACDDLSLDRLKERRLSDLLSIVAVSYLKELKPHYLRKTLGKTVDRLLPDSVVYQVSVELANLGRKPPEFLRGKTVLSVIKNCCQAYCLKPSRVIRLTRNQRRQRSQKHLIDQRRRNGDL